MTYEQISALLSLSAAIVITVVNFTRGIHNL